MKSKPSQSGGVEISINRLGICDYAVNIKYQTV